MASKDDIDDAFDSVVFLEERYYDKGFKEGYDDGKDKGLHDGRHLGLTKGCEVGGEVGFYLGFVSMWLETLQEGPNVKTRCIKLLETLKMMILELPVNDPTNQELFAGLEKVRAKFRQVCSLLGVNAEYSGGGMTGLSF